MILNYKGVDERFKKINRLLSQYSLGQFDKKLELSPRLDEIDAFIAGVNMLGEELKAITVSRNYFTNIFHTVSDMVFILNKKGYIEHVNKAASEQLEYEANSLQNIFIDTLQIKDKKSLYGSLIKELKHKQSHFSKETVFQTGSGRSVPVRITAAFLLDEGQRKQGILLTAKDISLQLKTENLIIRAIIDTQEKEQKRLAQDLHDSLGQQLSAIKFYMSAILETISVPGERDILARSCDALTEVINDMRDICFNLMPKTLEEVGLIEAVNEMCNKVKFQNKITFHIHQTETLPELQKEMQIDVYRVIQEFINNAIRHGKASRISIKFSIHRKSLRIILQDNGKGFDPNDTNTSGMGIQNVQSRVKSHNGEIFITSEPEKGTRYILNIPLTY